MVSGFQVPENVRYHSGHTWALSESRELVRVGMDDFASKLVGKIESIALPQRGRWVRQGQKIWTIFRDGKLISSAPARQVTPQSAIRDMVGRELSAFFVKENHTPGDLLLSGELDPIALVRWGVTLPLNVGAFRPRQCAYLAYHRKQVFRVHEQQVNGTQS